MSRRTWFITGISSGFGREMTQQLLEGGDRVAGTVRKPDAIADLKKKYGDQLWVAELDVTDVSGVHSVVDRAFAELGSLDVVVNNAGYGLMGPAEEFSDAQVEHVLDTNLLGSITVSRSAIPRLRAQGHGRIIQISTFGGLVAFPGGSIYHAGKWGIEGFTEALVGELAPFGIGVTLVEPGGARTNFRYGSSRLGTEIEAYRGTPGGAARKMIEDGTSVPVGDPAKMAAVIIASAGQNPAPKRLVLGSDSYNFVHKALTDRLAELEAQREVAFTTDFVEEA
ncbi:SDR family oxidoreductase [Streptacidiphilus sp. EB129]|uniref:SDR family oxidoreductase n=1 Tax=Streptacidiphilus sp. EB129 TaxID=3156262 RepID=UPI003514B9CD